MVYIVDFTDSLSIRKIVDIEAMSKEEALRILKEETSVIHVRSCRVHIPFVPEEIEDNSFISLEKAMQIILHQERAEFSNSNWFGSSAEDKLDILFERLLKRYLSSDENFNFHKYFGFSLGVIYEKFPTVRSFSRYLNSFLESTHQI